MYRFLLTPRWWGINVFVLLAIPFCIFMGSWQLSRFEDRVTATGRRPSRSPPTAGGRPPLAELLPVDKVTSGRAASPSSGRYDRQLLVPGRQLDDRERLLRPDPAAHGRRQGPARGPGLAAGHRRRREGARRADRARSPSPVRCRRRDARRQRRQRPGGASGRADRAISAASLVNLVPYGVYDAWVTLDTGDSGMRAVPATAPADTGLDLKAFQNLGYTGEWFVFAGLRASSCGSGCCAARWSSPGTRNWGSSRTTDSGTAPEPAAAAPDEGDAA